MRQRIVRAYLLHRINGGDNRVDDIGTRTGVGNNAHIRIRQESWDEPRATQDNDLPLRPTAHHTMKRVRTRVKHRVIGAIGERSKRSKFFQSTRTDYPNSIGSHSMRRNTRQMSTQALNLRQNPADSVDIQTT